LLVAPGARIRYRPGVTATLAELYVKQGLIGKAREIYRRLAAAGDESARRRLLELPSAEARIRLLEELLERVRRRGHGFQGRPGANLRQGGGLLRRQPDGLR